MRIALRFSVARVRWFALAVGAATSLSVPRELFAAPLRVACVGEQTTHSDQLNRTVEYPAMLQKELGAAYNAMNFGDCCSTVLRGYPKQPETHPYLSGGSAPSYKESLTFAPDIVVIGSWGKHDTEIATSLYSGVIDATTFQTDYEALVTAYASLPNSPRVFLSTPVPIPKGAATGPTTMVILPTVRAMAAKYNLPIVDLYPVFLNQPQLYKDDTHVTDVAGLQTIADTVHAALMRDVGGDAGPSPLADAGLDTGSGPGPATDAGLTLPGDAGIAPAPAGNLDSGIAAIDAGEKAPNGETGDGAAGTGCQISPPALRREGGVILLGLGILSLARRRRAVSR